MAKPRGDVFRLYQRRGGSRSAAGRSRSPIALVLLALLAAVAQLALAGHVPMAGRHGAVPAAGADHHAAARPAHHHAEHGGKPVPQEKPGHGSSGATCNLCGVCSGTAPPLPAAGGHMVAPCPQPARADDARPDEAPAARHFLTALRPRAPPPMVRSHPC